MIREVAEGPQTQGEDERIAYALTTTNWGTSPGTLVCKLYDVTGGVHVDASTTNLTGSVSASGDVITSPVVHSLTVGKLYRLEFQFICSGNTFEAYAEIGGEYYSALDAWDGPAIGEGQTTAVLYARAQPDTDAPAVTLWERNITLLLWHAFDNWLFVSDLTCSIFGWSHGGYIVRTL